MNNINWQSNLRPQIPAHIARVKSVSLNSCHRYRHEPPTLINRNADNVEHIK